MDTDTDKTESKLLLDEIRALVNALDCDADAKLAILLRVSDYGAARACEAINRMAEEWRASIDRRTMGTTTDAPLDESAEMGDPPS